ncbi:MAG TPA: trypsin-like serine protease [Gaiellaceae bacterium]|nr:trypsin-like serine protease [Gaiellaceae bacterium]
MRKILALGAALAAALAIGIVPASAITDGQPDAANDYPHVGLMVAHAANGVPLWRCSGTMLSSTVFLTAGHCTEAPAAHVEIFFSSGYPTPIPLGNWAGPGTSCAGKSGYPCDGDAEGTPQTHPSYDPNAFFLFDLGVVQLSTPFPRSEYGILPSLNQLDALTTRRGQQDRTFTAVGYGLQLSSPVASHNLALRTRMIAHPKLNQINGGIVGDFAMLLSNNSHTGGTCFGDSGGPNFVGNSNVVAGVTSFGLNGNCAGTGGVYRVDRADDLNWLDGFLP